MKLTTKKRLEIIKHERDKIADCKEVIACAAEDTMKIKAYFEKTKGPNYPDMTAGAALRLQRYERMLQELERALNYHLRRMEAAFQRIEDKRYTLILRKRYLQNEKWEAIAEEMNYSVPRVMQLHREAMRAYAIADKGLHTIIDNYSKK